MKPFRLASGTEDVKPRPPWESLFFAYAAMVPLVAGALACWLVRDGAADLAARLSIIWAGAILCFLGGVRRGLAFRQPGGPPAGEIAGMVALFALGFAALALPYARLALGLEIAGFAALAVADPLAASRGEAPRYFARLRPAQMGLAALALAATLAARWQ